MVLFLVDVVRCCYDGLPYDRFVVSLGFGACYVKGLDGKLLFVCSRFVVKSRVPLVEDLVRKELFRNEFCWLFFRCERNGATRAMV